MLPLVYFWVNFIFIAVFSTLGFEVAILILLVFINT